MPVTRRTDSTEVSTDPFDDRFSIFLRDQSDDGVSSSLRASVLRRRKRRKRRRPTSVDSKGVAVVAAGHYGWLLNNSNKTWEKGHSEGLRLLLIQRLRLTKEEDPSPPAEAKLLSRRSPTKRTSSHAPK